LVDAAAETGLAAAVLLVTAARVAVPRVAVLRAAGFAADFLVAVVVRGAAGFAAAPDLAAVGRDVAARLVAAVPDLAAGGREVAARLAAAGRAAADSLIAVARLVAAGREAAFADVPVRLVTAVRLAVPAGFATAFFAAGAALARVATGLVADALVADALGATAFLVAVVPVPVRVAAGLVGAFLAAAIPMFLLANDCGLVSAWRLTNSGLDTGSQRPA
jgi:hypothetical protein